MSSRARPVLLALGGLALLLAAVIGWMWWGASNVSRDTAFTVQSGSSLSTVARDLQKQHVIASASRFRALARLFAGRGHVQAGEFLLPKGASGARIVDILQHGQPIRRFLMIPEGLPSILVYEKLMSEPLLTGSVAIPAEGSILPQTYDFQRGESRAAVLSRMQQAMTRTVSQLWPARDPAIVVKTPEQAVTLASIVEKETGKPAERKMVAGLYSNRVRQGMLLQADPTIIYPITRGKPLGRRIRQSEIQAVNDYNTYTMVGLPKAPITNPGRAALEAVLHPAQTDALYMVADGTGGHVFASTLAQHNANVAKWFAIRRARGEL